MGETTTTTTTKADTTTTTTEAVKPQDAPKGDAASINHPGGEASPNAERQGEVKVDKKADTEVLGGGAADPVKDAETNEQNIADAKAEALRNAAREREDQPTQRKTQE